MAKKIIIPYKPMTHQKMLHNCNTSLVAVCGRQIGKSVALVNEIIKRALTKPSSRNWYVTNDYKQAKRNVWDLFTKYLPKQVIKKKTENPLMIKIKNNSIIELMGVHSAESLRGATVDFMGLDEYKDFPSGVWDRILQPMFTTTNGQAWFIGTPQGLGNDFYRKYTEDNKMQKFKFASCRVKGFGKDGEVISTLSQYANKEVILDALRNTSENSFKQEYLADFTRPSGCVYDEWNIDHYKKIPYDDVLPLHITFDWGINDPTAVIWIQTNGSETRVIDYYEASDANIDHFVQVIRSKPYKEPDLYCGDIAGRARELGSGLSVIDQLAKKGIYVRTRKIPNIPFQIRVTHRKIKNLWIAKKAERFRDIILNYHYPEKSSRFVNQSNEKPVHDEWSHGARAFEYWCVNTSKAYSKKLYSKPKRNSGAELQRYVKMTRELSM